MGMLIDGTWREGDNAALTKETAKDGNFQRTESQFRNWVTADGVVAFAPRAVDNFPTVAALNQWFATGEFNRNPIGVTFDFEEIVERHRAGESEAVLLHPRSGETAALMSTNDK